MTDVENAVAKLAALANADPAAISCFVSVGDPVTKSRARYSRTIRRFYTPHKTEASEQSLAWEFKLQTKGETLPNGAAILAVFYRSNRQRIDADNMMKLVMDAATRAKVWRDDSYVCAQASIVEMDTDNPRTVIAFCAASTSMDRDPSKACSTCGKPVKSFSRRYKQSTTGNYYCSPECMRKARYLDRGRARCPRCGVEFQRATAGQRYCSRLCNLATAGKRRSEAMQRDWPLCLECGKRVSRREYLRCSDCSPKGRKRGSKNRTWKGVPIVAEIAQTSTEDHPKSTPYESALSDLPF